MNEEINSLKTRTYFWKFIAENSILLEITELLEIEIKY